jgi:hypothetical protein
MTEYINAAYSGLIIMALFFVSAGIVRAFKRLCDRGRGNHENKAQ